ncbi:MAG TPA: PEPxxWA-CTERM sorting domain-containing protein [Roseiarcus sp.]|nr:PEPxxWA-CTERM sorting domain-containing protein [Roseiarcus sp.]
MLPNGNWLINNGDATNSYNQYNPTTGMEIAGTNIVAPASGGGACGSATGVDNDGTHLFFDCNFNTIVETDMAGNFITSVANGTSEGEDISLVQVGPINPPGTPEPSTWAMMLAGFAGMGYVAYRRRNGKTAPAAA